MVDKHVSAVTLAPAQTTGPRITIESPRLEKLQQRVAIANIVLPSVGTGLAIASLWVIGLHPSIIVLTLVCYTFVFAGMTVGLHRYLSHKGFTTSRFMHVIWLILGSMAAQGPPINWVSIHRRHHQYSDLNQDPHSPHRDNSGQLKGIQGF
ncbi:MAG: fatty acid desaturase, partial [Cyanobacteria bacterium J06598_3]